jgi:hypothetical protein
MNCPAWLCQLGMAGPAGVMLADMADVAEQKITSAMSFFLLACLWWNLGCKASKF